MLIYLTDLCPDSVNLKRYRLNLILCVFDLQKDGYDIHTVMRNEPRVSRGRACVSIYRTGRADRGSMPKFCANSTATACKVSLLDSLLSVLPISRVWLYCRLTPPEPPPSVGWGKGVGLLLPIPALLMVLGSKKKKGEKVLCVLCDSGHISWFAVGRS